MEVGEANDADSAHPENHGLQRGPPATSPDN